MGRMALADRLKVHLSPVESDLVDEHHRNRVRAAAKFYHEVHANPALLKRYSATARKRGIPLPAVTLAEYFKAAREGRRP